MSNRRTIPTSPADADAIARRYLEFFGGDVDDAVYAARRSGADEPIIAAIRRV